MSKNDKKKETKKLYTLGEELTNSISHGVGSLLSVIGLVIMIIVAAKHHNTVGIVTSTIFGVSLIILYTMSTLYHAITNIKAKNVLKVFDHCTIYLLIAGTYTPFTLLSIYKINPVKAWIVFAIVWIIAVFGTVLYSVFKNKFKVLNMISYIAMGWAVVIAIPETIAYFKTYSSMAGLYLLLAGGIAYTLGTIFYGLQKKNLRYFHSIWHFFVLAGSICQFLSLTLYVL